MMNYEDFKKNCYVEDLQKYLDLTKSKLQKYFKQHKIKMELLDLDDYKDFCVEVTNDIVYIKYSDDFTFTKTELKNAPMEFRDVIINHEMFIITLINLHKALALYIHFFEEKINLSNEDLFQYFLSITYLFNSKNKNLQDFFDQNIEIIYIDNDRIIVNNSVFLTNEDQNYLLTSIHLLRFVKLLQSIKKLVDYLENNYYLFYKDSVL